MAILLGEALEHFLCPSINTTPARLQPFRYSSYFFDQETNLYHLSQRYYDPETFSFLSKDPAKADGEESIYQYCGGDPVNKVDPSGGWSADLHYRMTYCIARRARFKKWTALIVARAAWFYDWSTSPVWHFNPWARWISYSFFYRAVMRAWSGKFISPLYNLGYALHLIQDSFAHVGPFWKHKAKWDNPKWKPHRYRNAKRATKNLLIIFKRSIPWHLRKVYCY